MENLIKETAIQILNDFEIEKREEEQFTEEALLRLLEEQVAYYIERRLEFLLSSMYRLDINEKLVRAALSPSSPIPANVAIAKLILERQKQRVYTKHFYKQAKIEDLEEGLEY